MKCLVKPTRPVSLPGYNYAIRSDREMDLTAKDIFYCLTRGAKVLAIDGNRRINLTVANYNSVLADIAASKKNIAPKEERPDAKIKVTPKPPKTSFTFEAEEIKPVEDVATPEVVAEVSDISEVPEEVTEEKVEEVVITDEIEISDQTIFNTEEINISDQTLFNLDDIPVSTTESTEDQDIIELSDDEPTPWDEEETTAETTEEESTTEEETPSSTYTTYTKKSRRKKK